MFYTITIETMLGYGDASSDQQTVHEGQMTIGALTETVRKLEQDGQHVMVFRGKGLGILQYETEDARYEAP